MRAVISALWATMLGASAVQGPAESALDYAKKLGVENIDLAPNVDTAIISEISPKKREWILSRLQRLAADIKGEDIEIGSTRVEGSLAGVILRIVNREDPLQVQVLSLAMVQEDDTWRAAPVPASFEHTVVAYSRSSRSVAKQLELWLAREQAVEFERLRQSAGALLRKSLARTLSPETIRAWSAGQFVTEFAAACDRRDTSRLLAMLGGLSETLPHDWPEIVASVRNAVSSPVDGLDTWSLLTSPAVLRIPVWNGDDASREISLRMLFLDPRAEDSVFIAEKILTINTDANELWVVEVSESDPVILGEDEIERVLASHHSLKYPLRPQVSAEMLKSKFLASLGSSESLGSFAELIYREGDSIAKIDGYVQAAAIHWEIINPAKPVIPIELDFHQEADHAYLAMQWLSLGKLLYSPRIFHFQKTPVGWLWDATPAITTSASSAKWAAKNEKAWRDSFLDLAVRNCATPDISLPSPDASDASALVEEWLRALASANWQKALSLCAQLGTVQSPTLLLRNLGYECKSIRAGGMLPSCYTQERGKMVTLVATRAVGESLVVQSFLPVISTPRGPRILIEIDLGDSSRPGRAFLNRNAIDRLSTVHPTVAEEIKGMLSQSTNKRSK